MRRRSLSVFLGYTAVSFGYFGWRLFPHPGRELVGHPLANDASIFIWSFAWWPHATLHWTNPFVSHVIYAPTGVNLASATSVPGLAVVFSPVTLLFGPDVSYNVAAVLLPALSAWTAYLLCRYLARSTWAAIVGGYLYGFSSYMLGQESAGHFHLNSVFLVPIIALVLLRYVRSELSPRGLVWRLGVILAFQAYMSTEVIVTVTLMLAVALVLAFALIGDARPRLRSALAPIAAGYALAGLLAAPLLYYALTGLLKTTVYASAFDTDLLNFFVPTHITGIGGGSFASVSGHFPGEDAERDAYFGLPALVIVALYVFRRHRLPATRFLIAAFGISVFFSLGTALYVDGHRIVWLPWSIASHWTGFEDVLPSRFAVYAALALSAMVSIWIATVKGRVFTQVLPTLAVVALVPPFWADDFVQRPQRIALFSAGLYKICIPRGETLMIFPFGPYGESQLWQAETGFYFKLAEGSLGHKNFPANFASDPTNDKLLYATSQPSMSELRALAERRHVDRVVSAVEDGSEYPSGVQMHAFGALQLLGNAFIAPTCGYDSLAGDKRPPPTR